MSYNERLADRVRELLEDRDDVTEKAMFSGICFMVDEKMCICVTSSGLLCRIGASKAEEKLEDSNCRQMINNGRTMKDFVYVDDTDVEKQQQLRHWLSLCLEFNPLAKSSKKKK
jgi:TfoX/Sxy family transcriptional regulator of competence genes